MKKSKSNGIKLPGIGCDSYEIIQGNAAQAGAAVTAAPADVQALDLAAMAAATIEQDNGELLLFKQAANQSN